MASQTLLGGIFRAVKFGELRRVEVQCRRNRSGNRGEPPTRQEGPFFGTGYGKA